MKIHILVILIIFTLPAYAKAADWKGKTVRISKGTLICDYFHIEKAMIFLSAGDKDSVIAYIEKGYCTQAPNSFYAAVVTDTSSFSDNPMVEIVLKGESGWVARHNPVCCYMQSNGERVKAKRSKAKTSKPQTAEWNKKCTPEEALAAFMEDQMPPPVSVIPTLPCPD